MLGLHGKRVAELAVEMGGWLELDETALRDLGFAARLHEIGLMGMDPESQAHSDGLPAAKRREIAQAGYRVLSKVTGFARIARAVRDQTERYDAPALTSDKSDPHAAAVTRLLAVADVYDSAVHDRQKPLAVDHAAGWRALEAERGKKLDPELVDLLTKRLGKGLDAQAEPQIVEVTPKQVRAGMMLVEDLVNAEGVLLARAGTQISPEMVERVARLWAGELSGSIRVYTSPPPKAA